MSHIRQIQLNDVQRLTSGQVIIDLTTAIKELIDNSIDAHASQIDILFKNYCLDNEQHMKYLFFCSCGFDDKPHLMYLLL